MLRCFKVNCISEDGKIHTVGVVSKDEESAKDSAVRTLLEGQHIMTKVISVTKADGI